MVRGGFPEKKEQQQLDPLLVVKGNQKELLTILSWTTIVTTPPPNLNGVKRKQKQKTFRFELLHGSGPQKPVDLT